MANKTDVEFSIRARDVNSKSTITQVVDLIKKLTTAQEQQADSSEETTRTLRELNIEYGKLQKAGEAVIGQKKLVDSFRQQAEATEKLQKSLQDAKTRLEGFRAQTAATKEEQTKLNKELTAAEKAVAGAEKRYLKATSQLDTYRQALDKIGVNTNDLAAADEQLAQAMLSVQNGLERSQRAIEDYDAAQRRSAATTKAKAEAEKAAAEASKQAAILAQENADRQERLAKDVAAADARFNAEKQAVADKANKAAADNYVKFWEQALSEREAAERQAAARRQAGDQATTAVGSLRTFQQIADAAKVSGVEVNKLSQAIRDTIDPSAAALRTLSGLEQKIEEFGAAIAENVPETQKLKAAVEGLGAANKALVQQASLIDQFKAQQRAVDALAAEYKTAQAEVRRYADALRTAEQPTQEMAGELSKAEASAKKLGKELEEQVVVLRRMSGDLKTAGINTRDLANEEARLAAAAQKTTTALGGVAAAQERLNAANQRSATSFKLFGDNGRTTLSLLQRIRGEILALTASYAGVFGAIQLGAGAIEAVRNKQAALSKLTVANAGDTRAAAEDYAYLVEQAERLGIALNVAEQGYSRIAIAAKAAGMTTQDARFIFESFSERLRSTNATAQQFERVFYAVDNILSKGKVSAEELRGQLGDNLTGAFYDFATAVGVTAEELNVLLEKGLVPSTLLVNFADQLRKTAAGALPQALDGLEASIARFDIALTKFKLNIAEAGAEQKFVEVLERMTEFLNGDEGARAAEALAKGFKVIGDVILFVIDNLDQLTAALKILLAYQVASTLQGWAAAGLEAGLSFGGIRKEINSLAADGVPALKKVGTAIGIAFSLYALYEFLDTLVETNETAKKVAISLGATFTGIGRTIVFAFESVGTVLQKFSNLIVDTVGGALESIQVILYEVANIAERLGAGDIAAKVRSAADTVAGAATGVLARRMEADLSDVKDQYVADMKDIVQTGVKVWEEETAKIPGVKKGGAATATPKLPNAKEILGKGEAEKEAKEREKAAKKEAKAQLELANQVANELHNIDERVSKQEAETLDDRIAATKLKYEQLYAKIAEIKDKATRESSKAQLDTLVDRDVANETEKFKKEEITKAEKEVNEILAARRDIMDSLDKQREAGLISQEQYALRINEVQDEWNAKAREAIDKTIEMAKARGAEGEVMVERLRAMRAELVAVKTDAQLAGEKIKEAFVDSGTNAVVGFFEAVAEGQNVFRSFGEAVRQVLNDMIRMLMQAIARTLILKALGGDTSFASVVAGTAHSGGIAGSVDRTRTVPAAWFANAQRYHSGGMPGLAQDEVPAILQRGEEVLAKNDPRNVMNGGGQAPAAAPSTTVPVTVINTIDSGDFVSQGLNTPQGGRALMNYVRANRSQFKAALT